MLHIARCVFGNAQRKISRTQTMNDVKKKKTKEEQKRELTLIQAHQSHTETETSAHTVPSNEHIHTNASSEWTAPGETHE